MLALANEFKLPMQITVAHYHWFSIFVYFILSIYRNTLNLMACLLADVDQVLTVESTISNLSFEWANEQCHVLCARMWTCVTSTRDRRQLKLEMRTKSWLNQFLNQRINANASHIVITRFCWLINRTRSIKSHTQTRAQDTYRTYSDFWEEYQMTDHDTLRRRHQEVTL